MWKFVEPKQRVGSFIPDTPVILKKERKKKGEKAIWNVRSGVLKQDFEEERNIAGKAAHGGVMHGRVRRRK